MATVAGRHPHGCVLLVDAPVTNYAEAQAADHERYARFFHGLLDRDVFFAPSGYETLFVSLAHTDADIDRTLDAVAKAAALTSA